MRDGAGTPPYAVVFDGADSGAEHPAGAGLLLIFAAMGKQAHGRSPGYSASASARPGPVATAGQSRQSQSTSRSRQSRSTSRSRQASHPLLLVACYLCAHISHAHRCPGTGTGTSNHLWLEVRKCTCIFPAPLGVNHAQHHSSCSANTLVMLAILFIIIFRNIYICYSLPGSDAA